MKSTSKFVIDSDLKIRFGRAKSEVTSGGIVPRRGSGPISLNPGLEGIRGEFVKVCADFDSGIKWGIGFVLERTCGEGCTTCANARRCRHFTFRPHYEVEMCPKPSSPLENVSFGFILQPQY